MEEAIFGARNRGSADSDVLDGSKAARLAVVAEVGA